MMAAAAKKPHLDLVPCLGILFLCPCCNSVTFLSELPIGNIIDNIIVLITKKYFVSMLFSRIFHQIINCFCVLVRDHIFPL